MKRLTSVLAASLLLLGFLTACDPNPNQEDTVAVTTIIVSASDSVVTIDKSSTVQLSVAVSPDNATDKTVSWSSSSKSIATVSNSGLVTGVAAGDVVITATANDGSKVTGTYSLSVEDRTPDLSSYYKKYFIGSTVTTNNAANWNSGTEYTLNTDDNNSLSLTAGTGWSTDGAACAAYTVESGTLTNYSYAVFTADVSSFNLMTTGDIVAVKVPETQVSIVKNSLTNEDGTITYYAPLSKFTVATTTSHEIAFILYGTGTVKIKEAYIASAEDPTTKAITGITISPSAPTVIPGKTQTFTVKNSNYYDVTAQTTFEIEGTDATGSSISSNVLTAGATVGTLTVKAKYTFDSTEYTATAAVTVKVPTNLITSISKTETYFAPNWGAITDGVSLTGDFTTGYTYVLPLDTSAQWQAQLKLTSDSSVEINDDYYFSVVLESNVDMSGVTIKFDNDVQVVYDTATSLVANTPKTIVFQGTSTVAKENIMFVFDFGNNKAGTVKITDLIFAKTN